MALQSPFGRACFAALDALDQRHRTPRKSLPLFPFWLRFRHIRHSELQSASLPLWCNQTLLLQTKHL
jgi:hypothetical protein